MAGQSPFVIYFMSKWLVKWGKNELKLAQAIVLTKG